MMTLDAQFVDELDRFLSDFWVVAESAGYPRNDESALHLQLVYSRILVTFTEQTLGKVSDDIQQFLDQYPPRDGSELEGQLGQALKFYSLAKSENSLGLFVFACQSLSLARVLLDSGMTGFGDGLLKQAMSLIGRKGAAAAHVETNKLKNEVVEYWSANIDRSLSNEKAATELLKQFPLAHRTLRDYVAEAKRKIRPAGKA